MAAYMEFDLNDSQASYSPSSSSPSIGRLSVWSDQEDDKPKPCGKFCDHQFGEANEDQGHQVEDDHEDSDRGSYKWMPSKMRILRKMMSANRTDQSSDSGPKFEDQKQSPLQDVEDHNKSHTTQKCSFKSLTNETVRVCSDCNTTKTPLWRSGPRGPKSLCNACGIRQRKARRAMAAAAAAAANGTVLPLATSPLKIKLKHKNKRPKIDIVDTDQSNKRRQVAARPSPDGVEEKLIRFEEFTTRILRGFEKVFPQDEKEAAILLMALSYGLVCS